MRITVCTSNMIIGEFYGYHHQIKYYELIEKNEIIHPTRQLTKVTFLNFDGVPVSLLYPSDYKMYKNLKYGR